MDVLCSDKNGTITQNQLSLPVLRSYAPFSERDLLRFCGICGDEASQDPIELAVLARVRAEGVFAAPIRRIKFIPFEPASKLAEATVIVSMAPRGGGKRSDATRDIAGALRMVRVIGSRSNQCALIPADAHSRHIRAGGSTSLFVGLRRTRAGA